MDEQTKVAVKKLKDDDKSEKQIYPYNRTSVTPAGHVIERSDVEGAEIINIRHGLNRSYIKIFPDGTIHVHSPGKDVNIFAHENINIKCGSTLDKENDDLNHRLNINVVGDIRMDVEGNMHCHVRGDRFDKVDGDYQLTVGNKYNTIMADGGIKCSGTYVMDVQKHETTGSTIKRNLKEGGIMRDSFAGTYIIEQTSTGGVLKLSSMGDMEIYALGHIRTDTMSNMEYTVGGYVDFQIAGQRVIGTPTGVPTGPLSPSEGAFTVTCLAGGASVTTVLGNIDATATVGTMSLFAGGPYLDVNCLTGVYLN